MFGSARFVPNVQTVEFGSTGRGNNFQLFPKSLERAMAPDDPGLKSPNPKKDAFRICGINSYAAQEAFLYPKTPEGRLVCMPRVPQVAPLSVLA